MGETPGFKLTGIAAAALNQYTFAQAVTGATATQLTVNVATSGASTSGGPPRVVGVVQNAPAAAGAAVELTTSGVSKVRAGGAIAIGQGVRLDYLGRAIAVTYDDVATRTVGIATSKATAADQIVSVFLQIPALG